MNELLDSDELHLSKNNHLQRKLGHPHSSPAFLVYSRGNVLFRFGLMISHIATFWVTLARTPSCLHVDINILSLDFEWP